MIVALDFEPHAYVAPRVKGQYEALAVPSVSLINPTGIQEGAVYVLENGSTARRKKVRLGVVAEGMTEIRSGLTAGERVVAGGPIALRDEAQV
jgi:multidrug efflux pump subunit AcrA (membrane-fusion protein)